MLQALIADEEKHAVLFDVAADRASIGIHLECRPRDTLLVISKGVRVQGLVPEALGCRAVKLVGAALGRHRNNALAAAVLRSIIIDGGPHLHKTVRVGHYGSFVEGRTHDAEAVKLHVVREW